MPLSDIVKVEITTEASRAAQAGFGTPLILGVNMAWGGRARSYASLAEMVADGMGAGTPEYKAAEKVLGQTPRTERVVVGRRSAKPTPRWKITPAVRNVTKYELRIGAQVVSFTSDADALGAEIVAGLIAAVNALGAGVVASDGGAAVVLTGTPGSWQAVEALDTSLLAVEMDHADPGVAADLDAILLEDSSWYAILNPWNSKAEVLAIAAWAEANGKLYVAASQDTAIVTAAEAGATDVAKAVKDASYARTAVIYHPANDAFADAAWCGRCLPLAPGSETWAYKTLAGVPVTKLTATHIANAAAKNANWYESIAGVAVTREGKVSANEWIDVIRFRDWLEARIAERVFSRLAAAKKIPFTDGGIAIVEAEVRAQLSEAVTIGGLAADPAPTVSVPRSVDVAPADRAARRLRTVGFTAFLAGAIHTAKPISGTVTV